MGGHKGGCLLYGRAALIPSRKDRLSSELRSQPGLGPISTGLSDHLGTRGGAVLFFWRHPASGAEEHSEGREGKGRGGRQRRRGRVLVTGATTRSSGAAGLGAAAPFNQPWWLGRSPLSVAVPPACPPASLTPLPPCLPACLPPASLPPLPPLTPSTLTTSLPHSLTRPLPPSRTR